MPGHRARVAPEPLRRGAGVVLLVVVFRCSAWRAAAGGQCVRHRADSGLCLCGDRFAVGVDDPACDEQCRGVSLDGRRTERYADDRTRGQPDALRYYIYKCAARHRRFGMDDVAHAARPRVRSQKRTGGTIIGRCVR